MKKALRVLVFVLVISLFHCAEAETIYEQYDLEATIIHHWAKDITRCPSGCIQELPYDSVYQTCMVVMLTYRGIIVSFGYNYSPVLYYIFSETSYKQANPIELDWYELYALSGELMQFIHDNVNEIYDGINKHFETYTGEIDPFYFSKIKIVVPAKNSNNEFFSIYYDLENDMVMTTFSW